MKRLLPFAAMGLLFVFGCQQEEFTPTPDMKLNAFELEADGIYVMGGTSAKAVDRVNMDLEELSQNTGTASYTSYKTTSARGQYSHQPPTNPSFFYKSTTISISSTENEQGLYGRAQVTRTYGEPDTAFIIHLDIDCLMIEGNEVVFAGLVDRMTGTPPEGFDLGPDARVFFKAIDNGSGPSAAADQYHPSTVINPSGTIPCEAFGPTAFLWNIPFLGVPTDVAKKSDYVTVN